MPESPDYRKFIEGQLESLHESINIQFKAQNETLIRIEAQTVKSNGRIGKLEDAVYELRVKEANHIVSCPNVKRIDEIEKDLSDYNFFRRNPKIGIGIIVASVLIVLFSYFEMKNLIVSTTGTKTEILK